MSEQSNQTERQSLFGFGEIDEGLERDLRAVLGWDDNPQENEDNDQHDEQDREQESDNAQRQEVSEQQEDPNEHTASQTDDPEFEIDGEKVKLSQIREWRKQGMFHSDYTRKTQQLAEERRQLEAERERLKPYIELDQFLMQNPQVADMIRRVISGQMVPPVVNAQPAPMGQYGAAPGLYPRTVGGYMKAPGVGTPPYPNSAVGYTPPVTPTAPGVDPVIGQRLSRLEEMLYDQQLDRMLNSIRSQADAERQRLGLKPLSNEEWDQLSRHLMQEAYTTKSDLNRVWASSPVRVQWAQEAAQSAQQAALAAKKEKERQVAGSVLTGTHRGGPVGTQKNQSPKDLDDAVRLAYQDLREQGLSLFTPDE